MIFDHFEFFPTLVSVAELDIDHDAVAQECLICEQKYQSRIRTNIGGWQSNDLIEINFVVDELKKVLNNFLSDVGINSEIELEHTWVNINRNNDQNAQHIHPRSDFSAVYYPLVPDDNQGVLTFLDPRPTNFFMPQTDRFKNDIPKPFEIAKDFIPKTGVVVIFPSWLPHAVTPSLSKEPRISIATNGIVK